MANNINLTSYTPLYPMVIHPYEQLLVDQNANVMDKINSIIDYLNQVGKLTNDVVKNWNTVYQWAMNDGLTTDISNKLEQMLANHEFDSLISTIVTEIGPLANLTTSDKTTIVNAINSLQTQANSNTTKIGNLSNLQTVDKTDLVTAINDNATQLAQITSQTFYVYDAKYGMVGDGVTDDTTAFQKLLTDVSNANGGKIVFDKNKTYKLTQVVNCALSNNGNIEIIGNNSTIHFTNNITYLYTGILTIGNSTNQNVKIKVENLNFNLDGVTPNWASATPNGGKGAMYLMGKHIEVRNCDFSDCFYSAAVWTEYGENVLIENCTGIRVGGRASDNTQDARGDAFYLGYLGNRDSANPVQATAIVRNCKITGYPVVENQSTYNSSQQGRIGVTVENCATGVPKQVTIENCYFYNFNRNVHVETTDTVNLTIKNTYFDQFGMGVWMFNNKHVDNLLMENCTFNRTKNVGNIPEPVTGGIGGYAVSSNTVTGGALKARLINCKFNYAYYQKVNLFSYMDNMVVEGGSITSNQDLRIQFSNNIVMKKVDFNFLHIFDIANSSVNHERCSFTVNDFTSKAWINPNSASGYVTKANVYYKDCVFTDLYLKATGNAGLIYSIENCVWNISNNFVGDYAKYCVSFADGMPNRITNSKFYNASTSKVDVVEPGGSALINGFRFDDNYIEDMTLKLESSVKPVYCSKNYIKFIQNLAYTYFMDVYNGKVLLNENVFEYNSTVVTSITTNFVNNKANALLLNNNYSFDSNSNTATLVS